MGEHGMQEVKKHICAGLLAHVDAGKTTLSEGLLYLGGAIRKLGRVDHRDAFLDTDALERERGITIFSKQAVLTVGDTEITLLDTPGHADFSAETERTLAVLDCAILLISGSDGIQGHTMTLWRLLKRYNVPTFIFVNKTDLAGVDRTEIMSSLKARLDEGCIDFTEENDEFYDSVAMCDEGAMGEYLETGAVSDRTISDLAAARRIFPCCFGSALKLIGVEELISVLKRFAPTPQYSDEFGARVYKIIHDPSGARLTCMKITGGQLKVKSVVCDGEKADQIRIYSGSRFAAVDVAEAGCVCAVAGLSKTFPGQGLGCESGTSAPLLEPVMTYTVMLPDGCDPHSALGKLRILEEEDPQLHIVWDEQLRRIHLRLMGEIQLEVLKHVAEERFGLSVNFDSGSIVYRETIAAPVIGMGHFEPLRHYAEVQLLLQPLERGAGLIFGTQCSEDVLDRNWQRLVLTHLYEREHIGVLTGSPLTDMKITLITGRAHPKHTEGGDFRQATYRAVRQGLMQAESLLLEPWYSFRIELPQESVGRAMSDLQRMSAEIAPPDTVGDEAVLTGSAPVSEIMNYTSELNAYTKGRGRMSLEFKGFDTCHNSETVIGSIGYDCLRDTENTADSVFCEHGSGYNVPWDAVAEHVHTVSPVKLAGHEEKEEKDAPIYAPRHEEYRGSFEQDEELMAIYERTYGKIKRREFAAPRPAAKSKPIAEEYRSVKAPRYTGDEYLLVDGYNIIFAWDELKAVARDNLDAARKRLMDMLSNYQGYKKCRVILVFDAYKVPRGVGEVSKYHNITVVYTKEAETADTYIEKATYQIGREHRVRVATSDNAEQLIILGHGALRISASAFYDEVVYVREQISNAIRKNNITAGHTPVKDALERASDKTK